MKLRLPAIALLLCYTLLMTLIAVNNITDYGGNWPFVQHVLAMDTTFQSPALMWRSITEPHLQAVAYLFIIATQSATAVLCVLGLVRIVPAYRAPPAEFERSKQLAYAGVTLSLVLWLGGFLAIGAEWFAMWQSETWNGADAASRYLLAGGIVLLVLSRSD